MATTTTKAQTAVKKTSKKTTKKKTAAKKNLVIVESPAKAKTIEKYLGRNYKVVASVGHIRDLKKSSSPAIVKTSLAMVGSGWRNLAARLGLTVPATANPCH